MPDLWDAMAVAGILLLAAGLYVVFGAGTTMVVVGALLLAGGLVGASSKRIAG